MHGLVGVLATAKLPGVVADWNEGHDTVFAVQKHQAVLQLGGYPTVVPQGHLGSAGSGCYLVTHQGKVMGLIKRKVPPPAFQFLAWVGAAGVHQDVVSFGGGGKFQDFPADFVVKGLVFALAGKLAFAIDPQHIVPGAGGLGILPAGFVEILLVVVGPSRISQVIFPSPKEAEMPDVQVPMMGVVIKPGFARHSDFIGVGKIAAHHPPVDGPKMTGRDLGHLGGHFRPGENEVQ